MRRLMVDTNRCSAYFAGDEEVVKVLAEAETVYVSVVVLGELEAGFRGGTRYMRNHQIVQRFLAKPAVRVLDVTCETAEVCGAVKHRLRADGTPIPINDVWLAAQALEIGAVLYSGDRHFSAVAGLRWRE